MKMKKILSLALSFVMVCSVAAVSSISASAIMSYNENLLYTYDSSLRDYSYGTGYSEDIEWDSNQPKQCTYNTKSGWMRWQSQTAAQAADENDKGQFALQWQWYGYCTPEFNEQFKAGYETCAAGAGTCSLAFKVANAETAIPVKDDGQKVGYQNSTVQIEAQFNVKGVNYKGEEVTTTVAATNKFSSTQLKEVCTVSFDASGVLEDLTSFTITGLLINVQDYTFKDQGANLNGDIGMGNFDMYISPVYAGGLTATCPTEMGTAADYTDTFNPADYNWEKAEGEGVGIYGRDDVVRDSDHYAQRVDNTYYVPTPADMDDVNIKPDKIVGVSVTASGTSATVKWTADKNAVKYTALCMLGTTTVATKTGVIGTTCTFTGLAKGKTYKFKVRGANGINQFGPYSDEISKLVPYATLTVTGSTAVNAGKTITLKANDTVTKWTTSNKAVATVTSKGVVKGLKKGSVKITAYAAGSRKVTKTIAVKASITKIKLSKTKATLKKGKKLTLKATITPSYAKSYVAWSTSKKTVATVSSKGVVTAKKKGTAYITCYATDGSGKKTKCKITVK